MRNCVCLWRHVRRINLNKGKVIQTMALKQRQSNRLTFTLRSEPFSFVQFWKISIFKEYQPNEMLHRLQLRIKWSVSPLWISVFFFLIGVEPFNKNDKCLENTIVSYNRAVCWRKHRWNKSAENEVQGKYNTIIQSINSRAKLFFSQHINLLGHSYFFLGCSFHREYNRHSNFAHEILRTDESTKKNRAIHQQL